MLRLQVSGHGSLCCGGRAGRHSLGEPRLADAWFAADHDQRPVPAIACSSGRRSSARSFSRPTNGVRSARTGAVFLVGLEGPLEQLLRVDEALRLPVWQLSLGRKAFASGGMTFGRVPPPADAGRGFRGGHPVGSGRTLRVGEGAGDAGADAQVDGDAVGIGGPTGTGAGGAC